MTLEEFNELIKYEPCKSCKKCLKLRVPEPCRPVLQMTLKGDIIAEYPSVRAAAKAFTDNGAGASLISKICLGRPGRYTYKGYKWKYKMEDDE